MIVGAVQDNGDALVAILVRGPGGVEVEFSTVVDTGFNGWLALSADAIATLALAFREEGRFTLADGSRAVSRLHTAEVRWINGWRRILVVELDGGPLLGMAMLRGSHLGVDVADGGRVEIRPLQAGSAP